MINITVRVALMPLLEFRKDRYRELDAKLKDIIEGGFSDVGVALKDVRTADLKLYRVDVEDDEGKPSNMIYTMLDIDAQIDTTDRDLVQKVCDSLDLSEFDQPLFKIHE
jgi:hypothetical protein